MPQKSSRSKRVRHTTAKAGVASLPASTKIRDVTKFSEADKREVLPKILELVHSRTGHDFSQYKTSTMMRRIQRRQHIYRLDTPSQYLELLVQRPEEVEALFEHLLVGVTCFFRDPEAFSVIERKIIPAMMGLRATGEPVRIWVAGCATGEEAYSLAMVFLEAFEEKKIRPLVQIFATDIDRDALAFARRGRYPQDIASAVTAERLKKFFHREPNGFRVNEELRSTVRFAEHDIIRDPPFGGMHLISCRNVMIYLERSVQERIYEIFHYAVKPSGFLWLGPSESIEGVNDLFAVENKKQRIFRRRSSVSGSRSVLVQQVLARDLSSHHHAGRVRNTGDVTLNQLHERLILTQLAPASVIVNDNFDIVHTIGDSSPYFTIPPGEPTHNLMKVARKGLRMALRAALHMAFSAGKESRVENLRVSSRESDLLVTMMVQPVFEPPLVQAHAMVSFEQQKQIPPLPEGEAAAVAHGVDPVIDQLEEELQQARQQLQATVEAYETSNEELQSSNEELRSMNEELQSATEELEAGKEEFQSMNEELSAVNQTLKVKIEELSRANSDLRNFLAATDIGTMFLDRNLCVIRYTPRVKDVFNIINSDKGRPLAHLTHTLDYPFLEADAREVLEHLETLEREIRSRDHCYLVRILPYRTVEEQIGGVVLTLMDITERKRLEQKLQFDADILARVGDAVIAVDNEDRIAYINTAAANLYHIDAAQASGRLFSDYVETRWENESDEKECHCNLITHGFCKGQHLHVTKDGREIPVEVTLSLLTDEKGDVIGTLSVIRDVTERVRAMQKLEESENRLRRMTDAVPGAVYKIMQTTTGQRNFLFMSRGGSELTGLAPEQMVGGMETFYEMILPQDLPTLKASMDKSAATLQPFLSEFRIRLREGRTKWLMARAVPHPAPENAIIWNGFFIDNTERREREDFVRSIYDGVASLIAVIDVSMSGDLLVTECNPAYAKLLKRMGTDLKGKTLQEIGKEWAGNAMEPIIGRYKECLDSGESIQYERRLEVSGQVEWYLTRLSPLRDAQGRIFRIISMSTPITEAKEHEEEQLRASKLEALGVLAGGIAHDFNNIIMGISLNLDLLLSEMDSQDSLITLVRESSYATARASELSRRLLTFAKGGKPVKQVVDLRPALQSVVDFALTGSSLKAEYEIDSSLECVDADLGQVSQVFDNLVINAREACREGGILNVRAYNADVEEDQVHGLKKGRYVCVQIEDHGPGIPEELLNKIFDPYFTTKSGGNGIGLATCYATLRNHDGAILVESAIGCGATFSIYIPVAVGRQQEPLPISNESHRGTQRLLLIDDDSLILSTMSRALRMNGYHVDIAPEGAEGARLYLEAMTKGEPYDFVLLDANIPGGLGGEVALRELLAIDPGASVILCSGYSASNLLSDWQSTGFKGRLQKPFSVYDVANIIQRTLVK